MRQNEPNFSAFLEGQLGGNAIEYGLIAALISVVIVTAITCRHKADYEVQHRRYFAIVRTTSDLSGLCFLTWRSC